MDKYDISFSKLMRGEVLLYDIFEDQIKDCTDDVEKLIRLKVFLKSLSKEDLENSIYLQLAKELLKQSKKDCLKIFNQLLIKLCSVEENNEYNIESLISDKTNKIIQKNKEELYEFCVVSNIQKEKLRMVASVDYIFINMYKLRLNTIISKYKLDFLCDSVNISPDNKLIVHFYAEPKSKTKYKTGNRNNANK